MASKEATTPADPTDTEVVDSRVLAGCRAGERDARQRLYELCHAQVYRLMVRMVGVQDAADVTQQVFLHLFRKIDTYAGHSAFNTWLYRLATNEALQYLRKGKRWKFQPLLREPTSQNASTNLRHEQKELLELALSRIDPELRAIFVLREVEGLSYSTIAEALDIPEGTVGSRMNRTRRQLQQHLTDLGWEP